MWLDGERFGRFVDIWGDIAVIGAPSWQYFEIYSSVYIFDLSLELGDLDFDKDVDLYDFGLFAVHWLENNC